MLQTRSVEVFANSLFHGIVSMRVPLGKAPIPVLSSTSNQGPLVSGATVVAGLAPASAFTLNVNGQATSRTTEGTWTPFYQLGHYQGTPTGQLVLHQFPLNALLGAVHVGDMGDHVARLRLGAPPRMALHRSTTPLDATSRQSGQ